MAYIGNTLRTAQPNYQIIDDISANFNGSTTTFALQVGGVTPAPFPVSAQHCLISVGGVIQQPDPTGTDGFLLSGSNIVFSSAPSSGESFFGTVLAGADYINVGASFPDGSVANPSITFDQDLDTGLYRSASGTTSISANGTNVADFGPSVVTFDTGGSESVRIDSSGKLLVGTSSSRGGWWNTTGIDSAVQAEATNQWCFSAVNNSANTNGPWINIGKSRGTTVGSTTVVQSSDQLGGISFQGADGSELVPAAAIQGFVDGTPGSNDMPGRLTFSTTADGASSPTERMRISQNGALRVPAAYTITTGNAANCSVQSDGTFQRSTSSIKYKTDVETLENEYADNLLNCRPVWYRSLSPSDNAQHSYWGFIAEEVAAIDPRLVHWKTVEIIYDENGSVVETPCDPEPEGVQYDRFVPHLLNLIKRQKEQIETQGTAIAALETRLTALEGGAS